MCMVKNKSATDKLLRKNKTTVVVWKIYKVWVDGCVASPIYPSYCGDRGIKPGTIHSNRESKEYDRYDSCCFSSFPGINRGIHVYLTRKSARKEATDWESARVFRCTAMLSDLVGVGDCDLMDTAQTGVFMKIHITPEEFAKGKKGRN